MHLKLIISLAAVAILSGCVTARPYIPANSQAINSGKVIGVAQTQSPTPQLHKTGGQGLLDMAINAAVTGTLNSHIETISTADIDAIDNDITRALRAKRIRVKALSTINHEEYESLDGETLAYRDYSSLRNKGIDYLILIRPNALGARRGYYGFIPTTAPEAWTSITAQMIDLTNNQLVWHNYIDLTSATNGDWDDPDNRYPALTKAITFSMKSARQQILGDFTQSIK